jgi:hypothetical protein
VGVTRSDITRAQKAYWTGDLGPARRLLEERPDELASLLDGGQIVDEPSWEAHGRRRMFLEALRELVPGDALAKPLLALALGSRREEREAAQAALARGGAPVPALIAALASGDKDTRLAAAEWLPRLRAKEAVGALTAAFRKEKVELVRAAQLRALVGLGAPIEAFLDRGALEKDADKLLARGVQDKLAFLSIDTLPSVRWRDGAEVPRAVIAAWLVAAHKTKSPMASPLLVAYAGEMVEAERERLGKAIFDRWCDEDFRLPEVMDPEVAERLNAWAEKKGMPLAEYARTPDFKANAGALGWMIGKTLDTGALDHRGVLAVAGALAPRTLVPELVRYVKLYRGLRIGASRAMLHVLAGMEDRAATQALVRFSLRFRTASLRKEAEKLVNELAARRGWSAEELADRTIPTAGLDERGVLALAYLPAGVSASGAAAEDEEGAAELAPTRTFEARIDDDLDLALSALAEDGSRAPLAKLPEPRKDEDEAQAAAEKKRLSAAKKELKAVVAAQRERLFAAMCSERAWPVAEFGELFLAHPVMRRLLERVVLRAVDADGRALGACRVSEDGSLVTPGYETLVVPAGGTLRVAHGSQLGPDEERLFAEHLAEHRLAPLFPQLGRARHALDPAQPGLVRILPPPEGARVSSFVLRGRMKRLGWERGPTGDGGYVDRYVRPFVPLGLEAHLVHTAVPQPEEDTPIEVEGIEVLRLPAPDAPAYAPRQVVLARAVPAVLRHELWNDLLAAIAR